MPKDMRSADKEAAQRQEVIPRREFPESPESIPPVVERPHDAIGRPETTSEQSLRETEGVGEESAVPPKEIVSKMRRRGAGRAPSTLPVFKDHLEEEIEDILEEHVTDLYRSMSPETKQKFREAGEETRSSIRQLLKSAKINAKKIFSLIRRWLNMIPGANRFFLEQEAKIKTDKILMAAERERTRDERL